MGNLDQEAQIQQQQQQQQSTALTMDGHIPEAQVVGAVPAPYPQGSVPPQPVSMYQQQQQQPYQQQYQQSMQQAPSSGYGSVVIPVQQQGQGAPPTLGNFAWIQGRRQMVVKQRFHMMEAAANAAGFGCVEFENEYDVYDGETGEPVLYVKEESNMFERCCFKPFHAHKLMFHDVRPGVPPGTIAMFSERPFKCCCCACCEICQQETKSKLPDGTTFSHTKMPTGGGGFAPKMEVMDRNGAMEGFVTGPGICIGGCAELFRDIEFGYHDPKSGNVVGRILKKKPSSLSEKLKEAVGDHDTFVVDIPLSFTPEQAASFIATTLLIDYIFFESEGVFQYNPVDNSCSCNLCTFYCYGCICPCVCKCGGNNDA